MLSQTGVCLCTVQVGFVSVCVCVCFEALIFLNLCGASMGHLCVWVCFWELTAVLWFIRMLDMSFGLVLAAWQSYMCVN